MNENYEGQAIWRHWGELLIAVERANMTGELLAHRLPVSPHSFSQSPSPRTGNRSGPEDRAGKRAICQQALLRRDWIATILQNSCLLARFLLTEWPRFIVEIGPDLGLGGWEEVRAALCGYERGQVTTLRHKRKMII